MGVKWPWCMLLWFCLASPLINLSFFLTFINMKHDARAHKANPRDTWTGLMCGSFATMKACVQVEERLWREGGKNRKQRARWRCERNLGNDGQARLTPWRCRHFLSPCASWEYKSLICPFLTLKPPQPWAMPSTCTLFHPKFTAKTQQVINNETMIK